MTKEQLEKMLKCGMGILRERDIELGAMDADFSPANHLLSADENKQVWNYLAERYVLNFLNIVNFDYKVKAVHICPALMVADEFFDTWIAFLQNVEDVVRNGIENPDIESIINHSGISREMFVKFLD